MKFRNKVLLTCGQVGTLFRKTAYFDIYPEIKIVARKHGTLCAFRSEICRVRPKIRASNCVL